MYLNFFRKNTHPGRGYFQKRQKREKTRKLRVASEGKTRKKTSQYTSKIFKKLSDILLSEGDLSKICLKFHVFDFLKSLSITAVFFLTQKNNLWNTRVFF